MTGVDILLCFMLGFAGSVFFLLIASQPLELLSIAIDDIRFYLYRKSKKYVKDKLSGIEKNRKEYGRMYGIYDKYMR